MRLTIHNIMEVMGVCVHKSCKKFDLFQLCTPKWSERCFLEAAVEEWHLTMRERKKMMEKMMEKEKEKEKEKKKKKEKVTEMEMENHPLLKEYLSQLITQNLQKHFPLPKVKKEEQR